MIHVRFRLMSISTVQIHTTLYCFKWVPQVDGRIESNANPSVLRPFIAITLKNIKVLLLFFL